MANTLIFHFPQRSLRSVSVIWSCKSFWYQDTPFRIAWHRQSIAVFLHNVMSDWNSTAAAIWCYWILIALDLKTNLSLNLVYQSLQIQYFHENGSTYLHTKLFFNQQQIEDKDQSWYPVMPCTKCNNCINPLYNAACTFFHRHRHRHRHNFIQS